MEQVRRMSAPQISVVVPMYNAAPFIDRTLTSIRAQSISELEIIVVDDGSTDVSPALVARHAQADTRIRLVTIPNGGVAAARNHGASLASAPYIAFVDADDLWTVDKLKKQLSLFRKGSARLGLVYCWFARIDADDMIMGYDASSIADGDVVDAICSRNLIGNGSSVLVRRDMFLQSGGFDPELRARAAEGCEDYDFYARMAGMCDFGLVREFSVGYRITDTNMSSNLARMARSRLICARRLLDRYPDRGRAIRHGRRRFMRYSLRRALVQRNWKQSWRLMLMMLGTEPFLHVIEMPGILIRARQTAKLRQAEEPVSPIRFKIGTTFPHSQDQEAL
ncbi:MAG: glycosyltransferase family 2 protein [Sphingobium sp.]